MDKSQATKCNVDIKPADIDMDVLSILGRDCALAAVESDKEMRRLELNCLCEMLSQMKHFQTALDETLNILSIVGNDKIVDFFAAMRENMAKEEAAKEAEDKN
jgi:hypothetical protein